MKFSIGDMLKHHSGEGKVVRIEITAEGVSYALDSHCRSMLREEEVELAPEKTPPEAGQLWEHINGNTYEVLLVANTAAHPSKAEEYPITVVYCNASKIEELWTEPLTNWHEHRTLRGVVDES